MTDEPQPAEPAQPPPVQPPPAPPRSAEREAFEGALRVAKRFLVVFLGSWVVAYAGGAFELEWLYFIGLGGVGVAMLGLMMWLIRG